MFTGLVETKGVVISNTPVAQGIRLCLEVGLAGLQSGESIAINGVCLTLLPQTNDVLSFDLSPETLKLTTLHELCPGNCVNIERAMSVTTRFGGHYVSGHVDTTAVLKSVTPMGPYAELVIGDFAAPADLYLLPKGSITIDGVSLTINTVSEQGITVMLIPHTLQTTTLGAMQMGQRVNVEFDYLTRIVAHQVRQVASKA